MKKAFLTMVIFLVTAGALFAQTKPRLAVLPFTGGTGSEGESISVLLSGEWAWRDVFTVQASNSAIDKIVKEHQYQMQSGLINSDAISEIDKLNTADFVVSGHITNLNNNNLVLISIIDVKEIQQVAGVYKTYRDKDEIPRLLPEIVKGLVETIRKNNKNLPGLAVPSFTVPANVNANDAMVLAQMLATEIANSGKYAVFPRNKSVDDVIKEIKEIEVQRAGMTSGAKVMSTSRKIEYILDSAVMIIEKTNRFVCQIVKIENGDLIEPAHCVYQDISDGLSKNLRAELASELTGEELPIPNGLTFDIVKDYGVIITEYTGNAATIHIPRRIKGLPVRSIGDSAFYECSSLTSVTIPSSVTSIGDDAFSGCSNLTSVTIPSSVTSIGDDAFSGCSNLTSVTIPSSVTSIGDSVFYDCSNLTSVTIPSSVTSIGNWTFDGCSNLTSVTIPSSVTSIGNRVFADCSNLTSVTIPSSVTSIGDDAFSGCSNLTSVTIPSSVTSIGNRVFAACSSLTSVTIPSSVTSIGDSVFYGCRNLTSVTIPSSVTSIGKFAFGDCRSLISVTIPSSVTSIGDDAFSGCSNLTSVTIPSSVTSIGSFAFAVCRNLTSVTIPSSVTSIGDFAFGDCRSLISVTIPSSVTSIGKGVFAECIRLTSVTIPSSVTSIGEGAFSDCFLLTNVTIPSSVTSIGNSAFYKCISLTSVTLSRRTTLGTDVFLSTTKINYRD